MRNFTLPSSLDVLARGTSVLHDGRGQAQRETTLSQTDVGWEQKWGTERNQQTEDLRERERCCKKEITYRKGMVQES